mgnify:CR=1 FL=1
MDTGGWESRPDGISVAISAGAELAMEEADILASNLPYGKQIPELF